VPTAGPSPRQHRRDDEDRDNPWAHVDRGGVGPPGLSWGPSSTSTREPERAWERPRDVDHGLHRHPSQVDHYSHHSSGYVRGGSRYDGLADPSGPYGGPSSGFPLGVSSSVIDRLRDDQEALRAQVLEQVRMGGAACLRASVTFVLYVICASRCSTHLHNAQGQLHTRSSVCDSIYFVPFVVLI
jgi:hypothetical protein